MRRLDGEKLRELRESRRLDQAAFAKRAQLVGARHGYPTGLNQPTVSKYELGGQTPSRRNLVAMALALGVTPDDLLVDEAQREQQEASSDDDEDAPLTRDEFHMLGTLMARLGSTIASAGTTTPRAGTVDRRTLRGPVRSGGASAGRSARSAA